MSRLDSTFAHLSQHGEKALIAYLTAGDPDPRTSLEACRAALRGGADILELGVPFSDPTADGPAIQRASERALGAGMSVSGALELCRTLREEFDAPIILFGYYNPLLAFGVPQVVEAAAAAGADGFLVVDLPPEESDELREPARARGLDLIYLLAPTSTPPRVELVRTRASGFVYYVSMTGVTGGALRELEAVAARAGELRGTLGVPLCIGFGISSPEQARALAPAADGVVVGSAFVRLCEEHGDDAGRLASEIESLARGLKDALRPG